MYGCVAVRYAPFYALGLVLLGDSWVILGVWSGGVSRRLGWSLWSLSPVTRNWVSSGSRIR